MPISRTFKAGLVAMVLIILSTVSRLDAAPMYLPNGWMQDVTKQADRASGSGSRRLDLDLNFPPPADEDGLNPLIDSPASVSGAAPYIHAAGHHGGPIDPAGRSYLAPHAQSTGTQHWQTPGNQEWTQHLTYDTPYGRAGVLNWQLVDQPVAYSHPRFDAGLGTSSRNEGHAASTSSGSNAAMPVQDPMRYAAALHERLAGPPLSDAEIHQILKGEPWQGLSPEQKSEFLNLFGERTFTWQNYVDSSSSKERWEDFHASAQKLVEEYLKVRWDKKLDNGPPKFQWRGEQPKMPTFPSYARRAANRKIPAGRAIPESAADSFDKKDPFKRIPLGEFSILAIGERLPTGINHPWDGLRQNRSPSVNVVAFDDQKKQRLFVGRATILLDPQDGAEPM